MSKDADTGGSPEAQVKPPCCAGASGPPELEIARSGGVGPAAGAPQPRASRATAAVLLRKVAPKIKPVPPRAVKLADGENTAQTLPLGEFVPAKKGFGRSYVVRAKESAARGGIPRGARQFSEPSVREAGRVASRSKARCVGGGIPPGARSPVPRDPTPREEEGAD